MRLAIRPFRRAIEMSQAIAAARAISDPILRQRAIEAIPPYRSRGKGRGSHSPSLASRGRYIPAVEDAKHARAERALAA